MLQTALQKIGSFDASNMALIEKLLVRKQFKKNEVLLAEGDVCKSVFLLVSGSVYQFLANELDENVIDLYTDGDWIMSYTSFMGQKPSFTQIKAYTNCEVFELTIHTLHHLIEISPVFFQLGKVMEQGTARVHYFDNSFTPLQKYNHLLANKPKLLQQFPLKMIASYLKITPETLSRVRGIY
ncbi:Crp/Fnr family transcriptional regulator [Emticicia sp. BO119]|uniref:Crp/Fnr family transcriptional regulator n=1 Tax=Emticicia sp. BO119 TaxID=2757768 RepID=UPI0015F0CF13|nr:Crp/Fnr family transcriptional regulator [Emticicia sp. BO119]MBA4849309.1 Crp/Fnr family transcriptional regulator [Emticicia sp. BO119]